MMAVFPMCAVFGRRLMAEGRRDLRRSEKSTMLSPKGCREPAQWRKEEVRGSFPIGAELVQDALPWAVYGQALLRIALPRQVSVSSLMPVTSACSSPDPISPPGPHLPQQQPRTLVSAEQPIGWDRLPRSQNIL